MAPTVALLLSLGGCARLVAADITADGGRPDVAASVDACATRCSAACVDLRSDDRHCGACGARCGPAWRCVEGRCACAGDGLACGLPSFEVPVVAWSAAFGADGALWVGGSAGADAAVAWARPDGSYTVRSIRAGSGGASAVVSAIAPTRDGGAWASVRGGCTAASDGCTLWLTRTGEASREAPLGEGEVIVSMVSAPGDAALALVLRPDPGVGPPPEWFFGQRAALLLRSADGVVRTDDDQVVETVAGLTLRDGVATTVAGVYNAEVWHAGIGAGFDRRERLSRTALAVALATRPDGALDLVGVDEPNGPGAGVALWRATSDPRSTVTPPTPTGARSEGGLRELQIAVTQSGRRFVSMRHDAALSVGTRAVDGPGVAVIELPDLGPARLVTEIPTDPTTSLAEPVNVALLVAPDGALVAVHNAHSGTQQRVGATVRWLSP